jgi:beta-lactamase class A
MRSGSTRRSASPSGDPLALTHKASPVDTDKRRDRRNRESEDRDPRHRRRVGDGEFAASTAALAALAREGAEVSAHFSNADTGATLFSVDDRVVLPIAGLGAVVLLAEVSARMSADEAFGFELLDKRKVLPVAGPGLWRSLAVPVLPVSDLALLIASVGDAVATNAAISRVGLDAVRTRADSLGLHRTALLDVMRDERGPDDAPQLAVGTAEDLATLFGALARGEVVDRVTSERVIGWLSHNSDLSLVADAFGLDPLAHGRAGDPLQAINKTGRGRGIAAEAGVVRGGSAAIAYAVIVRYPDTTGAGQERVLDALRRVGNDLAQRAN